MKKKLETLIETFLKDKRKSGGGWAQVNQDDMNMLEHVFEELRKEKTELDADGHNTIRAVFINRVTHESMHYFPTRYAFKLSDKDLDQEIQLRMTNLKTATESLDQAIKDREYRKK